MNLDHETLVMIWLAALLAPPILFGVWMRIKLMGFEEGHNFLVDREMAQLHAERETPVHMQDTHGEIRGKFARAGVDLAALQGSHGNQVAEMLKLGIPFMVYYVGYAAVIGLAGYLFVF